MARHVGRPTNEEVALRKRKQMLKILIPVGLITLALIMVIGRTGLRGLMGQSIYYCNPTDGAPDSNNICTSTMDARLLGDINGDSEINQSDVEVLYNIYNGFTSNKTMDFAVSDVNQDGKVDVEDYNILNNYVNGTNAQTPVTGLTSTESTLAWGEKYVCPVDYVPEGTTCIKKYNALTKEVLDVTINNAPDVNNVYRYGDKIKFNVTFSDDMIGKYIQYKSYYDDTKMNFISECKRIESKTISPSLLMNKTNRKIIFQVYSDNKCENKYGNSISTGTYKMSEDNISSIDKPLNTDTSQYIINNESNLAKLYYSKTNVVDYNQKLEFVAVFDKLDDGYYYQFVDMKDKETHKNSCMKVVSGMNIVHIIQADADQTTTSIAMYSDKDCKNMISGTNKSVTYVSKEYSSMRNIGDINVSINNKTTSQKLNYGSTATSIATFKINGSKKFYYKLRIYGDNKLDSESKCYLVENGNTSTANLKMNSQDRYAEWTIYEDSNCTKVYNVEKKSNVYELNESGLKIINQEKLSNVSVPYGNSVATISQPSSKFMTIDQKFRIHISFNLKDNTNDKKYYYKMSIYKNNKLYNTPECRLIVKNLEPINSITMDSNTLYGKLDIYDNDNCSGVPVASKSTKKYTYKPYITLSPSKKSGNYKIGTNIKIGATVKIYDDDTYYYMVKKYNNDKTTPANTPRCLTIKNGSDISRTLTINTNTTKLVWELYENKDSEGNCTGKISTVSSPKYTLVKTFTINYNSNGGNKSMSKTTITYGQEQKLRKNKFTKAGYYFKYWRVYNDTRGKWLCYNNKNKTSKSYESKKTCEKYGYVTYDDEQKVSKTASVGEKITLYAQWQYLYNDDAVGFNGFEKDPTSGSTKATVWPVINLTIYKDKGLKSSTGKTVPQAKALFVLDMTNKKSQSNSSIKIKYGNTTGWINGEFVMINLPDVIPSIEYDITNAKKSLFKNHGKILTDKYGQITNKDIYAGSWYGYNKRLGHNEYLAPVRLQTAKMIQRAQNTALKHNNSLKIYDLFRPYSAQSRVASALSKVSFSGKKYCVSSKFDPNKNSNATTKCITDSYGWFIATAPLSHNLGKALDVTLIDKTDGKEIFTQSSIHELSNESIPTSAMVDKYPGELALNNLFVKSGFHYLISEWWHFEDMGRSNVSGVERLGSSDSGKSLKLSYWNN